MRRSCVVVCCSLAVAASSAFSQSAESIAETMPFGIQVVDAETKRGVPMVELKTVNQVKWITDSGGWIAFHEPGLMNRDVFFFVSSHGYEYEKDGFGYRGVRLQTQSGATARIELDRKNLAERLYRLTGQGIYRDSFILGKSVPIDKPLLNGDVLGQDTVQVSIYQGRLFWIWGDTNRPSYPLGQFKASGAWSRLPGDEGLEPDFGVNFQYFVDKVGFSRPVAPVDGPGAVWIHGMFNLRGNEKESLLGHYVRLKELGKPLEHGLIRYNDRSEKFEKLVEFELDAMLHPLGQALVDEHNTGDYVYFCRPFPTARVRKDLSALTDATRYEAFTCLEPQTRFEGEASLVERDSAGRVVWGWKKNTDYMDAKRQHALLQAEILSEADVQMALRTTDGLVYANAGSVHWNEYRRRWIMIAEQIGGKSSFIGEIWYAEADSLEGPWVHPRHIVTHDKYSFYNPAQHKFFDQERGRLIYFEGTYVTTFSAAKVATPFYDYNQIMYRLDLSHPRLDLPPTGR